MTNETGRCLSGIEAQLRRIADVLEKHYNPPWPPEGIVLNESMPTPNLKAARKEAEDGIADARRSAAQAVREYNKAQTDYMEARLEDLEYRLLILEDRFRWVGGSQ